MILVRHGSTALNRKQSAAGESAERIRGWMDIPLDSQGKGQAQMVAKEIAAEHCVDRVYCSDLSRALETGRAVAIACKCQLVEERDLRPWNVGDWAGQPVDAVLPLMTLHVAHPESAPPGGEPFARFASRFLHRLQLILSEAQRVGQTVAVVTHTRNAQLTKAWIAADCASDLSYDVKAMNDYTDEMGTGELLVLRPAA